MELDFNTDINQKRLTTLEAYTKVKESGLLSELRLKVFEAVCTHDKLTASELRIKISGHQTNANSGVLGTRLSELERMGLIRTIGTRKCSISGYNALVWEVTGNMPIKLDKKKTIKQKKQEILENIEKLEKLADVDSLVIIFQIKKQIQNL
jgi:hypothetical protein